MKKWMSVLFVIASTATALLTTSGESQAQTSTATEIFDAKALSEWGHVGDANWTLSGDVIEANKGNGYLVSRSPYGDFKLRAEVWVDEKANSGIFIRCQDQQKPGTKTGYEVNIYDERPDPSYGTGAIVDVAKVNPMPKAGGKWNVMEITAKGGHFTIMLNGVVTVADGQDSRFPAGYIGLQYGAGTVKFRKIEISKIGTGNGMGERHADTSHL